MREELLEYLIAITEQFKGAIQSYSRGYRCAREKNIEFTGLSGRKTELLDCSSEFLQQSREKLTKGEKGKRYLLQNNKKPHRKDEVFC
nr:hypothetical protein [uncultured Cohaesibacter sp.]